MNEFVIPIESASHEGMKKSVPRNKKVLFALRRGGKGNRKSSSFRDKLTSISRGNSRVSYYEAPSFIIPSCDAQTAYAQ